MTVTKGGTTAAEDRALAQFAAAQGGTAGGTGPGQVYMGTKKTVTPTQGDLLSSASFRSTDRWMSADEAAGDFYKWRDKTQQDFLAKLKIAGLVQQDAGTMEASRIWKALVEEAAQYGAQGKKVSPMDILGGYVSAAGGMNPWKKSADGRFEVNALTGERRYIGPQFSTTTDTRTDFTDPATARALATKMFQDLMGRDPGKGEISQFASALAQAEAANPATAVTTTQYDTTTGEAVGSNTTTSGGLTADAKAQIASDQAKRKPEYGATQAATTFMGALDQAVFGAPS